MVNTHLLRFYMRKKGDTTTTLANYLGISRGALSLKLNNHYQFKHGEILKIIQKYKLNEKQTRAVFNYANIS